jgi:hypothetical protein
MNGTPGEPGHAAVVDAWLARSLADGSVDALDVFRVAFEALWSHAATTLGSATLIAIAERVLHTATMRYGFLVAVNPRPNGDGRWKQKLHERLGAVPSPELIEGLRFAMIELLTVIGRLTAEILTDELHAAIGASKPETKTETVPHALRSVGGESDLS